MRSEDSKNLRTPTERQLGLTFLLLVYPLSVAKSGVMDQILSMAKSAQDRAMKRVDGSKRNRSVLNLLSFLSSATPFSSLRTFLSLSISAVSLVSLSSKMLTTLELVEPLDVP